jgi:hypothetical protein
MTTTRKRARHVLAKAGAPQGWCAKWPAVRPHSELRSVVKVVFGSPYEFSGESLSGFGPIPKDLN